MSDDDDAKRRGIDRTAKLLREQSARTGREQTQTQARDRVVEAITRCDNRRNRG